MGANLECVHIVAQHGTPIQVKEMCTFCMGSTKGLRTSGILARWAGIGVMGTGVRGCVWLETQIVGTHGSQLGGLEGWLSASLRFESC